MSFPDTVTVEIPTACAAEIVYRMRGGGGSVSDATMRAVSVIEDQVRLADAQEPLFQ